MVGCFFAGAVPAAAAQSRSENDPETITSVHSGLLTKEGL
jgi:hypothetical protein